MKIAQVITRMDWGGSPDLVRSICERLIAAGHDVRLISGPARHPSAATTAFLAALGTRATTVAELARDIDPLNDIRSLRALYRIFRAERFDVVHTHTAKAGAVGRIAARLAGVRVIVHTPHGHVFYGYFGRRLSQLIVIAERVFTFFCDRIVCLTEEERADYLKLCVARERKLVVIPPGIELDADASPSKESRAALRDELGVPIGGPLVGIVSRLEVVKGPRLFIDAAILIAGRFPSARFVVIGEGSLRAGLERLAAASSAADRIFFSGWREGAGRYIGAFDILVLPSLNEAVGIVLIEAGAQGIPVVASRVGGIPSIVRDGVTGILVPPSDTQALASAIEKLLSDDAERAGMGAAARAWVAGRFSAERMVRAIVELYGEVRA